MLFNVVTCLFVLVVTAEFGLRLFASRHRKDSPPELGRRLWAFHENEYDKRGRQICGWGRPLLIAEIFVGMIFLFLLMQKDGWFM